jgi:hypothetical protein
VNPGPFYGVTPKIKDFQGNACPDVPDSSRYAYQEASWLVPAIASLVAEGFAIAEDGYVLALPLRQPGWRRAPSWDDLVRGQPVLA